MKPTLFIFALGLIACSQNQSSQESDTSIVGEWKGIEMTFDQTSPEESVSLFDPSFKLHRSSTLSLQESGSYNITEHSSRSSSEGSYYRDDNDLYFVVESDSVLYSIVELNDTMLHLSKSVYEEFPTYTIEGTLHQYYSKADVSSN